MNKEKVIISGAGLAGSLLGIMLAKRGYEVEIFEWRPDMRNFNISAGRSINLALSNRGLKALQVVGMQEYILREVVPMKGRLIHSINGTKSLQSYSGKADHYINSVSRGGLNKALMSKAEEYENVKISFDTKILNVDFEENVVYWHNLSSGVKGNTKADLIIGADGAYSQIRNAFQLGGVKRFDYSQEYLAHGYKELSIEPNEDMSAKIENDVLHIWPHDNFMMIALPNFDNSFTCTLFMPYEGEYGFDNLNSKEKVSEFFQKFFPDIIEHIPHLINDYLSNPTGSLVTVKCYPWHIDNKAVLLGDAAHAVVPFYGQGMNASFEDCLVFDSMIDEFAGDFSKLLPNFSKSRKINADAIAELAKQNYLEMRSHVANPTFVRKRNLELALEERYINFSSKYSLVTFDQDVPYALAKSLGEVQDEYLLSVCENREKFSDEELWAIVEHLERLKKREVMKHNSIINQL